MLYFSPLHITVLLCCLSGPAFPILGVFPPLPTPWRSIYTCCSWSPARTLSFFSFNYLPFADNIQIHSSSPDPHQLTANSVIEHFHLDVPGAPWIWQILNGSHSSLFPTSPCSEVSVSIGGSTTSLLANEKLKGHLWNLNIHSSTSISLTPFYQFNFSQFILLSSNMNVFKHL